MPTPSSQPASPAPDFYPLLCRHAAVAMIALDARFRIVAWNDAATALLGIPAESMIGQDVFQAVPKKRHGLLKRLLARTLKRSVVSELGLHAPAAGDPAAQLRVFLSPIPSPAGAVQGVAVWIVDETARNRLADRLAKAETMAALGALAGGVARYFKDTLGALSTVVEHALATGQPAAMKRALQVAAHAASKAAKVTHSLLAFTAAKPDASNLADLTEVVLTFAHLIERPLADRNIRLELSLKPIPVLPVDANRMHVILGNLLTNSEEAMPDGGTVTIAVDAEPGRVRLLFSDSGPGIPAKHLPLVFEPFFTTKGLTAPDTVNPGLGLTIAREMLAEMPASISADSPPNSGARFTLTWPLAP